MTDTQCQCPEGCRHPATTRDDGGQHVCADCVDYAVDADGQPVCAHCRADEVVETRHGWRMRPPPQPPEDPAGRWACYWDTVGDDRHVVSRHATRAEAEQAVAARDWPDPDDHTAYLCGYVVRYYDGGEWVEADEGDDVVAV